MTVGSILSGTFRFARDNIRAIVVWSMLMFLLSLLSLAGMGPIYQAQVETLRTGTAVMPSFGTFGLAILVAIVGFVALWAAVFRAVLFPAESRFAYLRLGMDELRLFATMLVLSIGSVILFVVAGFVVGLLSTLVGAAVGAPFAAFLTGLAMLVLTIWLAVRFSLAGPLTILDRKVIVGPAWRLTRGAFWRLFGAFLVIGLLLFALYLVVALVQMGPVLGDIFRPADPEARLRLADWQATHYGFTAYSLLIALVGGLVGGFATALQAGVIAVATDQLLDRNGRENLAEVFE